MINQINEATEYLRKHGIKTPEIGVILGTGLGNKFVEQIKNQVVVNYNSIPHFPISTVEFHKGKLIVDIFSYFRDLLFKNKPQ